MRLDSPDQYDESNRLHEEMLLKYIEYYSHWDKWVERRSVRTYYAIHKASRELYNLMKAHNRALTKDFYKYRKPRPSK
jgi:hypothetical protein